MMPWQRRRSRIRNVAKAINIADLRDMARRRLPGFVFEYLEGGAEDEISLQGNRDALASLRLIPRTLQDTSTRHQRIDLLGNRESSPLVIAPTGLNGLLHVHGDLGLARAASDLGVTYTHSTVSTTRLEDVRANVEGRLWMQLYMFKNRDIAESILHRAAASGYEALVFTTDANVFGNREWDKRNYWRPGRPRLSAKLDLIWHPHWLLEVLMLDQMPRLQNIAAYIPAAASNAMAGSTVVPALFDASLTWDDLKWIRRIWPNKLLLKGVLNVDDAKRAVGHGCDGIVITNHGGRQLDSCIAPIHMLPRIAAAVGEQTTLIIDGGFQRGTEVVKALALGADAVMVGRSTLYGLAAGGEPGARRALEILVGEIDRTLGLLGCRSISELEPQMVQETRMEGSLSVTSRDKWD